ncbi:SGNH hydrolase-type esterase domain-containing protein, partial [Trichoderma chlorosporum]
MTSNFHQLVWRLGLLLALVSSSYQQEPYDDFSWVLSFAAVGDSYTAGIGAGGVLDVACSRYDGSYAAMMSRQFPNMKNFYNLACSGAKSPDIMAQIEQLPNGLDLAVMTAGGNDLCLSTILSRCILSNVASQSGCNDAVKLAQGGLDTFFEDNVEALIQALDAKMNPNGIIVVLSYAQFFDANTDACTREEWTLLDHTSLPLSPQLRAQMNSLVLQTNAGISAAVSKASSSIPSHIAFANWDDWPAAVNGRFCEEGQSPNPFESANQCGVNGCETGALQFFKLNTSPTPLNPGILFRRQEQAMSRRESEPEQDTSDNYMTEEEWTHYLNQTYSSSISGRGIQQPDCPASSNGIPDFIGKLFHPTLWGHATMMSFALNEVRTVRAEKLGVTPPGCKPNGLTCTNQSPTSYQPYAALTSVQQQVEEFCSTTEQATSHGSNTLPFVFSQTYYAGAPDEVQFIAQFGLSNDPGGFWSTSDCVESFQSLLLQCWMQGNPVGNPTQAVYGGSYLSGFWTYTITPTKQGRSWPPARDLQAAVYAMVNHNDPHKAATYWVRGASWATWDFGQQTLLANWLKCGNNAAPARWAFEYYQTPDLGFEWQAVIQGQNSDTLWCMSNGLVIQEAGGPPGTQLSVLEELPNDVWEFVCNPDIDFDELSCNNDCVGYVACAEWCNAYCAPF